MHRLRPRFVERGGVRPLLVPDKWLEPLSDDCVTVVVIGSPSTTFVLRFLPTRSLEEWGVPDSHIHFEAFGPASIKSRQTQTASVAEAADTGIVATFARSGKQLPWRPDAGSLLEFAQANGIAANYCCRAGSCGTCQTAIRTGEVSYREPPDFDPEPGSCLLCVGVPRTSVTLAA